MDKNTVLSFCSSSEALKLREVALRNGGMAVISVMSAIEARYEIAMGRCGVLLFCYRLSEDDVQDIARLFKQYCSQGRIVFVEGPAKLAGKGKGRKAVAARSNGDVFRIAPG